MNELTLGESPPLKAPSNSLFILLVVAPSCSSFDYFSLNPSMTSSLVVVSPAELDNLGILFAAYIAVTFMYGFTFFRE